MMGVELTQSVRVCACVQACGRAYVRVGVCVSGHMVSKLGNFTQTVVSDHLCWSKS